MIGHFRRTLVAIVAGATFAGPLAAQGRTNQPPAPTNVMLTFHIIEADGFQGDDAEIRPVVAELRKIFRFKGYRLLSTSVLSSTAYPSSRVDQQVAPDADDRIFFIHAEIEGSSNADVRIAVTLDGRFIGRRPDEPAHSEARLINASVNLQNGKTVVLGSSRQNGQTAAIILAVTPVISS